KCLFCPKAFTRANNLHSHMLTHSQERPFVCDVSTCSSSFKRASDYRRHMKTNKHLTRQRALHWDIRVK
ncbi:hypothetical protein BC830DRAFT_1073161, partial [Chytriomyces sp. MP71]